MSKTWLILDCNYLCHRAKHSTGNLSYNDIPTGVVFGFLKDIETYQKLFATNHFIFCWDFGVGIRTENVPTYKANRKDKVYTKEETKLNDAFRIQMKKLRKEYLKMLGYRNIFYQRGYEADDMIAAAIRDLPKKDEKIIVSADHDLYQLLSKHVHIYQPQKRKMMTKKTFIAEYEIEPYRWPLVKAIAGCTSDNVIGAVGVGEKGAIAYLTNNLKETSKKFQAIKKFCWDEKSRPNFLINISLVTLPLKGVKTFKPKRNKLNRHGWMKVTKALGIKSLNHSRRD